MFFIYINIKMQYSSYSLNVKILYDLNIVLIIEYSYNNNK